MQKGDTLIHRADAESSATSPGGNLAMQPGPGGLPCTTGACKASPATGSAALSPALHGTTDRRAAAPSHSTRGICGH